MTRYQFSTVKLVPDLVKNEPVNIGVILYDAKKNKAYPKFTENWKEVSHRTGIEQLPELDRIPEIQTRETSDGFLNSISNKKFQDSIVVTEPKVVSIVETLQETLKLLFETQISLPSIDTHEENKIQRLNRWMEKTIEKMKFPVESYKSKYIFNDIKVKHRFPYVFLKNNFPLVGIELMSFLSSNPLHNTKIKALDIQLVHKHQENQKTEFKIFSAQEKDELDLSDRNIKQSLELFDIYKVPVIYKKDSEPELDKIRQTVLATA